jgi:hypothetical protein
MVSRFERIAASAPATSLRTRGIAHHELVQKRPHSLRGLQCATTFRSQPNALDTPVFAGEIPTHQTTRFEPVDESAQSDFTHLQCGRNFALIHSLLIEPTKVGKHRRLRACESHWLGLLIERMAAQPCDVVNEGAD